MFICYDFTIQYTFLINCYSTSNNTRRFLAIFPYIVARIISDGEGGNLPERDSLECISCIQINHSAGTQLTHPTVCNPLFQSNCSVSLSDANHLWYLLKICLSKFRALVGVHVREKVQRMHSFEKVNVIHCEVITPLLTKTAFISIGKHLKKQGAFLHSEGIA